MPKHTLAIAIDTGRDSPADECGACPKVAFASNFATTFAKTCRQFEKPIGFAPLKRLPECLASETP